MSKPLFTQENEDRMVEHLLLTLGDAHCAECQVLCRAMARATGVITEHVDANHRERVLLVAGAAMEKISEAFDIQAKAAEALDANGIHD